MHGFNTQSKSRAGVGAAIRTMMALGLAASLGGCAMVGMMGVMHGGMLGKGGSESGHRGSSAEGRHGGKENRIAHGVPQDCSDGGPGCDRSVGPPERD